MMVILLFHEVKVGIVKELLGGEIAIIVWDLGKHQFVALTEEELPEEHELFAGEIDASENDVSRIVGKAGKLETLKETSGYLS